MSLPENFSLQQLDRVVMPASPDSENLNRKRHAPDNLPSPPAKKLKRSPEYISVSEHPSPAFWDNLSELWLTRRALREVSQRGAQSWAESKSRRAESPVDLKSINLPPCAQDDITKLKNFSRHGGPDLTSLRGYSKPQFGADFCLLHLQRERATDLEFFDNSNTISSCYDMIFEQHLIDHGIFLNEKSQQPKNLKEIQDRLASPLDSLSASNFPISAFRSFKSLVDEVGNKADVMREVVPIICRGDDEDDFSVINTTLDNLHSLTDRNIVLAKPGVCYGAHPEQLNLETRRKLSGFIMTSAMEDKPMAPNFFLEVSGRDSDGIVAKRLACYHGAVGARGMHELQSAVPAPVPDNNAYTLTSTYQRGTLTIYATHVTKSGLEGCPQYHMTGVNAWAMSTSPKNCREGLMAFRNGVDLAREWRDGFICAANERVALEGKEKSGP